VDPTGEEEDLSTSILNVVTDGNDIFAVHKPGEKLIAFSESLTVSRMIVNFEFLSFRR